MKQAWTFRITTVLLLMLQSTAYVLLVRYTLRDGKKTYIQSCAVFTTEACKACLALFFLYLKKGSFKSWIQCIKFDVLNFYHLAEVSGLSLLFILQNNLGYFAIGNLEAGFFQVMSQLKIMTMAIFVVLVLKRKLFLMQWLSLLLLTCGACLMNFSDDYLEKLKPNQELKPAQRIAGIMAILVSATSSGFACVYNEKILTRKSKEFWVVNTQLYIMGTAVSFCVSVIKDGTRIAQEGYLTGFGFYVISIVLISSFGGLIISIILKTSGNIAKNFASSLAVVATTVFSHYYFNEKINNFNLMGIVLVIVAMPLFTLSGLK